MNNNNIKFRLAALMAIGSVYNMYKDDMNFSSNSGWQNKHLLTKKRTKKKNKRKKK